MAFSLTSSDLESDLGLVKSSGFNCLELRYYPAYVSLYDLMVIIFRDFSPDIHNIRKDLFCVLKHLDLSVVTIFIWVNP